MLGYIHATVFVVSLFAVADTQYDHKRNGDYHGGALRLPGIEYEYPEYDSKVHHNNRDLGWETSPQRKLNPLVLPAVISHNNKKPEEVKDKTKLKLVPDWPDNSVQLGQVSAASIDKNGNVVVFHRGNHVWGAQTFRYDNVYNERSIGPIHQNPVVVFHATTGLVVEEWGSNMFYLPHGLTVDQENNVWVTDVALHQVFKFPGGVNASRRPSLSLGTPFIPGNDDKHFCKPTDIAVLLNGDFFVADGYCNSRIIKFDKNGMWLMVWGRSSYEGMLHGSKPAPNHFLVPHAVTLAEEKELLFVADRENGRVQCFNASSGVFITQLQSQMMGSRIFSVAYTPVQGGLLYVVNGPELQEHGVPVGGFVISEATRQVVAQFNSKGRGFQNPHDVVVSLDGTQVYVVELDPHKVWKFVQGNSNYSTLGKVVNEENHPDDKVNVTTLQSAPLKLGTSKITAKIDENNTSVPKSASSVGTALGVIVSVMAVVILIVSLAVIHIRRGASRKYRELAMDYD